MRALDADLAADLHLVEDHLDWHEPPGPHRGRGVAVSASDAGSEPTSSAVVRVHADGSVTVMCGSTEMGQGSSTVLAQITAGQMGVPIERVALVQSDTATVTYDRSTGASRTTTIMGLAIQEATRDVIAQLVAWAREAIAMDGPDVRAEPGGVAIGDRHVDWGEIVRAWYRQRRWRGHRSRHHPSRRHDRGDAAVLGDRLRRGRGRGGRGDRRSSPSCGS